jgi:hypothetical protein
MCNAGIGMKEEQHVLSYQQWLSTTKEVGDWKVQRENASMNDNTSTKEGIMRHIGGISATAIALLAFAAPAAAQSTINEASDAGRPQIIRSENMEPNAEVVMTGQSFQIARGETAKGFMLLAGTRADIVLRNEDTVAHEFVSPMLFNVPFRLDGNGVFVKLPNAAGVRVDPGRVVRLSFDVPQDTKEFQNLYEVFWCNVHGKQYGNKMRGEVLVIDHRGEIGGG